MSFVVTNCGYAAVGGVLSGETAFQYDKNGITLDELKDTTFEGFMVETKAVIAPNDGVRVCTMETQAAFGDKATRFIFEGEELDSGEKGVEDQTTKKCSSGDLLALKEPLHVRLLYYESVWWEEKSKKEKQDKLQQCFRSTSAMVKLKDESDVRPLDKIDGVLLVIGNDDDDDDYPEKRKRYLFLNDTGMDKMIDTASNAEIGMHGGMHHRHGSVHMPVMGYMGFVITHCNY
tara:strand:+ start:829 stop:1524 length:696 start_codon:yes stop_codon:yes gene_type:complete